jgi:hypothetical protein
MPARGFNMQVGGFRPVEAVQSLSEACWVQVYKCTFAPCPLHCFCSCRGCLVGVHAHVDAIGELPCPVGHDPGHQICVPCLEGTGSNA